MLVHTWLRVASIGAVDVLSVTRMEGPSISRKNEASLSNWARESSFETEEVMTLRSELVGMTEVDSHPVKLHAFASVWVNVKAGIMKRMKKRYCILRGSTLFFYNEPVCADSRTSLTDIGWNGVLELGNGSDLVHLDCLAHLLEPKVNLAPVCCRLNDLSGSKGM